MLHLEKTATIGAACKSNESSSHKEHSRSYTMSRVANRKAITRSTACLSYVDILMHKNGKETLLKQ